MKPAPFDYHAPASLVEAVRRSAASAAAAAIAGGPDEIITGLHLPHWPRGRCWAFLEARVAYRKAEKQP